MGRKILLVGDLSTAFNYGAIATSDALLDMLHNRMKDEDELRIIDHRSFSGTTPAAGWPEWTRPRSPESYSLKNNVVVPFLKSTHLLEPLKAWKRSFNVQASCPDLRIPYLARQYELYAKRIINGEILAYEKIMLEWADDIIINGEGNIVNGIIANGTYRQGARYILFMAYLAKEVFGKKVSLVNHTVDPKNADAEEMIRLVYPMLDHISVREQMSLKELVRIGYKGPVEFHADALFSCNPDPGWVPDESLSSRINFSEPYICLGDSSGFLSQASHVKWSVEDVMGRLVDGLRKICPQVILIDGFAGSHDQINDLIRKRKIPRLNLHNCSYEDLIQVLGEASLFLSGRWHASIMAALSGTPFLLWGSDSHKTFALNKMYDSEFNFYDVQTLPIHIDDLLENANDILSREKAIRDCHLRKTAAFKTSANRMFDFL